MDSGCPLDLIDRSHIQGCLDSVCDGSKVTLATANGDTVSSEVLPLYLNKLKEQVQPHVLDSTPNVLSLGRRVIVDGYSFEWPAHSHSPWLVHPTTGEHIHLKVKDFVPYLEVPPNDAELREPWDRQSWVAAPSLRRDDGTVTDMEDLLRAVDTTPVARSATAAPGAASSSKDMHAPSPDDASLRSLVTGASSGEADATGASPGAAEAEVAHEAPPPPPPAPHKALRPRKAAEPRRKPDIVEVEPETDAPDDGDEVEEDDDDDKDWGTDSDGRNDLRLEALSVHHQLTHVPKNKYCPACVRAKMLRKPARRSKRPIGDTVKKFGDLVNADHVLAQSAEACGLFGERDALIVVDRYSGFIDAYPLMSKSAEDVHASLVDYFGSDRPQNVYMWSDSAPELIKAVHKMGICHGKALPGRHQHNGWCEGQIRNIVQGARTTLEHAGMPQCYWIFAIKHWCIMHNVEVRR